MQRNILNSNKPNLQFIKNKQMFNRLNYKLDTLLLVAEREIN